MFHIPLSSIFSKQNAASAWKAAAFDLLEWIQRALKEIVFFEIIRAYFHQPFNHYTWVVMHDRARAALDYYSAETEAIGLFAVLGYAIGQRDHPTTLVWLSHQL